MLRKASPEPLPPLQALRYSDPPTMVLLGLAEALSLPDTSTSYTKGTPSLALPTVLRGEEIDGPVTHGLHTSQACWASIILRTQRKHRVWQKAPGSGRSALPRAAHLHPILAI